MLLLVVGEVVGQGVGVAETAVAGGNSIVELLHQAHLFVQTSGNYCNLLFRVLELALIDERRKLDILDSNSNE